MYVNRVFAVCGGLERVWTDKMNALSELPGYEVCLVTTDQGDHQLPYPLSSRVRHIDLGVRFVRQYRYGLLRRLGERWRLTRLFRDKMKALLRVEAPYVLITTASEFAGFLMKCKGDVSFRTRTSVEHKNLQFFIHLSLLFHYVFLPVRFCRHTSLCAVRPA